MCIATPRDSIQSVASSTKKKNKRAMVNETESVVSTAKKKVALLNNVSGMNTANSTGRLNIS